MKERLDVLLVERGFFTTREKAKRNVMAGNIIVNEKKIDKPGTFIKLEPEPIIRVKGESCPYVSRGGYKLEKSIKEFNLDMKDKIILDVGSSTGGFTDCSLQNGCKFVYSVDVGTNQLEYKLREDKRVKSIEGMHVKDLTLKDLENNKPDMIVMDVSFISITKVIPLLIKFFHEETKLMVLIKPQFEVGKENMEKGGIIRDKRKHKDVLKNIIKMADSENLNINNLDFSPIKGGKGNVEYLALFSFQGGNKEYSEQELEEIIRLGETLGGEL